MAFGHTASPGQSCFEFDHSSLLGCFTMKKILSHALLLVGALPVMAQESATIDLSAAGDAATAIGTAVHDLMVGDILTAAKTVLIAGVILWALWRVVRWLGIGRK